MSRPSKKRTADEAAAAAQQGQGDLRLELDVITGSLWQPTCQALDPIPSKIPLVFDDDSHYRRTFEPLLMEEARGSLRAEFDEAMLASKGWPVFVTRCAPAKDGVFNLTLRPSDGGHAIVLREGAIVVLIRPVTDGQTGGGRGAQGQQQQQGGGPGPAGPGPGSLAAMARAAVSAGRWQQAGSGASGGGGTPPADTVSPMLAAMVRMRTRDAGQALEVAVRPCCGHQAHLEDGSPCNRALHMMFGSGVTTEADDGSPEMAAATANSADSKGRAGSPSGPLWLWLVPLTSLITNVRELRVLQRLGNILLLPELLRPQNFGVTGAAELPQVWPQDARHEAFYKHLYNQYDVPQREAIVAAAAHLATPEDLVEAEAQGIATGAAGPGSGAFRAQGAAEKVTRPLVPPITLVQGPPGTGKTHTVRGILNTWHSTMYHRHHTSWLRRAREILTRSCGRGGSSGGNMLDMYCSGNGIGNGGVGNLLDALSQAPLDAPKPRILVCAPSNAATDELLDRILTDGFYDFGGTSYRPNVVRVGAEEAPLSDAVKAVWTEAMINRYEAMGAEQWALAYKDCEARISNCNIYMASMATKMASKGSLATDADIAGQDLDRMAAELVRLNDHLSRAREEMARLDRMGDLATSAANRPPGYVLRRIREDLELSLMEEAEMVFTTLSSTGRTVFSRLSRGFDFVLIDEAAQASEIAALQPLMYGCRKLVMVGDPQQLPATLFSAAAKETLLERSLFERLAQAGMAVKMLSVQYRMHPEIRNFPSSYFYSNRLQDGESVLRAAQQPPAYYTTDLLKPYVVYDVCNGREYLQGRSRSNEAEAEMALGLFMELLATVRGDPLVGAAAADAAATVAASGGGRALREPTPPAGRGSGAAGNSAGSGGAGAVPETARGPSVESSMGAWGDAGGTATAGAVAAQQAFSFLERYTGNVTVGIITPYRAQRELIRRKFVEVLGPGVLDAVRIETVDSFQGKQLDVIILSCVRTVRPGLPPPTGGAGGGCGVGFLADVRRMNVAITRAKQALWVLGQFSALRREPSWAALIADAEERGCVIQDANALELCPQWEAFQERQFATATDARAQQQQQQQEQQQATAEAAAPAVLQEHLQQNLGQGPGQGPLPMGPGAPPPPLPPGYGMGLGAGQLPYQPPPSPLPRLAGAHSDWVQAQHQGLPPPGPPPGRQMQQKMPPPPQGLEIEGPAQGPEGVLPPHAQVQQLAAPPGHAPHAHPRVGGGRGGGGGRAHHRPRSLNQMQIRNMLPQLQPQPLAGQQQHASAAGAPAQQGPGRGRSALVSMLPKHGRGGGRLQGGPGRGLSRGSGRRGLQGSGPAPGPGPEQ